VTTTPYLVDVSSILDEHGASVTVDAPFSLDAYSVGDDAYTLKDAATVDATISNTGAGLVAYGTVTARVTAVCARCLCEFELPIAADIEGFYVTPGHDIDLPEEQEVEFIDEDGMIDIAPALHAAIVLETPFAPLHDAECEGICPTCGADLNAEHCACDHEPGPVEDAPNPFARLQGMFDEEPPPSKPEA